MEGTIVVLRPKGIEFGVSRHVAVVRLLEGDIVIDEM